jgi:hypothetical protein
VDAGSYGAAVAVPFTNVVDTAGGNSITEACDPGKGI